MIVDPTDPNYAIGAGSSPLAALRICEPKNPTAPTLKELTAGQIVGYTTSSIGSNNHTEES